MWNTLIIIIFLSEWKSVTLCVPGAQGGQKNELELQIAVNHHVGAENRTKSSGRAGCGVLLKS